MARLPAAAATRPARVARNATTGTARPRTIRSPYGFGRLRLACCGMLPGSAVSGPVPLAERRRIVSTRATRAS